MIISFDLDNTLIPYSNEFDVESKTIFSKIFRTEQLRKGTKTLFNELEKEGHELWIYTTSYRSILKIKLLFKAYGLTPFKVINQSKNLKTLKQHQCYASKNPKLFGIDVHIDDSKGVEMEGEKYNFRTIIIPPKDKDWTNTILRKIEALSKENQK